MGLSLNRGMTIAIGSGRVRRDVLAGVSFADLSASPLTLVLATGSGSELTFSARFGGVYLQSNYPQYLAVPANTTLRLFYDLTHVSGNTALSAVMRDTVSGNNIVSLPTLSSGVRQQFSVSVTLGGAPVVGEVVLVQDRNIAGFGSVIVHSVRMTY